MSEGFSHSATRPCDVSDRSDPKSRHRLAGAQASLPPRLDRAEREDERGDRESLRRSAAANQRSRAVGPTVRRECSHSLSRKPTHLAREEEPCGDAEVGVESVVRVCEVSRRPAADRRTQQPDARVGAHEGDLDESQYGEERAERR